jgi:hypothetical protein
MVFGFGVLHPGTGHGAWCCVCVAYVVPGNCMIYTCVTVCVLHVCVCAEAVSCFC